MLNIDGLTLDEPSSHSLQYSISVFILNSYFNLLTTWIKVVETEFVLILASVNPVQNIAQCMSATFIFSRKAAAKSECQPHHVCPYVGTEKRDSHRTNSVKLHVRDILKFVDTFRF